jgi:hypothetical protein
MNPECILFFVTNFADQIGGDVRVALLPAEFRGDLVGPSADTAVDFRIERLAREHVVIYGFLIGLLLGDGVCRFHGVLLFVQCDENSTGKEVQIAYIAMGILPTAQEIVEAMDDGNGVIRPQPESCRPS